MTGQNVLQHSRWDALLIALSGLHAVLLLTVPSIPLIALGLWWNSNTIAHNFVHLPFFRSRKLNAIYSTFLTLLLGIPQTSWRQRHLAHHRGAPVQAQLNRKLLFEAATVLGYWSMMAAATPKFFVSVYIPGYLIGLGLCAMHGHFEHVHGTVSNYGTLYNWMFLNDGFHREHHGNPARHWSELPSVTRSKDAVSRWPAIFRWLEYVNLESLERLTLRFRPLQQFMLSTHRRAVRRLLDHRSGIRTITIVGGGMFPRTALILRELLPEAEIRIVEADSKHIEMAKPFLDFRVALIHETFNGRNPARTDLLVIPLAFIGDRENTYASPPARLTLIHDWIWSKRGNSVVVSPLLLKRLNLVEK